jgi:hypothetical protein
MLSYKYYASFFSLFCSQLLFTLRTNASLQYLSLYPDQVITFIPNMSRNSGTRLPASKDPRFAPHFRGCSSGHKLFDCPLLYDLSCYLCGQTGHWCNAYPHIICRKTPRVAAAGPPRASTDTALAPCPRCTEVNCVHNRKSTDRVFSL